MAMYLVRNPHGTAVWLAYVDEELRVWSYVHNTRAFHLNSGLFLDFNVEHHNTYEHIHAAAASSLIRDGLGTLDPRKHGFLIRKFRADTEAQSVADVLARAEKEPRGEP